MTNTEIILARWLGAIGAGFGATGAVFVGAGDAIPTVVTLVVVAVGAGLSGLVAFVVKSSS